jgi:hypothetical protein
MGFAPAGMSLIVKVTSCGSLKLPASRRAVGPSLRACFWLVNVCVHTETRGGSGFSQFAEGDGIRHGVDLRRDSG